MLRVEFRCMRCLQSKRVWSSSRVFGGRYLANQKYVNTCASYVCNMTRGFLHFRMVHAFTCAGILQSMTPFKGGQTWILCGSKGMCTAWLHGLISGNHKHATAVCLYLVCS